MTDFMKYARRSGLMPDWAWYQLNGKSALENWMVNILALQSHQSGE